MVTDGIMSYCYKLWILLEFDYLSDTRYCKQKLLVKEMLLLEIVFIYFHPHEFITLNIVLYIKSEPKVIQ